MISLTDVCYQINNKTILENISFDIDAGEKVAIIGGNGSGKSTMVKLMAGLLIPSAGDVSIDNVLTSDKEYRSHLGQNIGFLFQNPDHQMISINVERELALGLENLGVPTGQIHDKVKRQIDKFNFGHILNLPPSRLSGGEKQTLALASALILEPDLLIFDEPVSHLDKAGKELFRAELNRMIDDDITVVYVSLDLSEVLEFDRIMVLEDGIIVEDCKPGDLLNDSKKLDKYNIEMPLAERIKNLNIDDIKKRAKSVKPDQVEMEFNPEPVISLSCENIDFRWNKSKPLIADLSLDLLSGKIYGLLGPTGCGKTTLAMILAGLLKPDNGQIRLNGKVSSQQDLIKQVAYIFQSPERAMFASNLHNDIAYGPRNFGFGEDEINTMVKCAFAKVGLDYETYKYRSPFTLSGGEARLAAIAGGLASDKRIVILDEPNEELDYPGKQRIGNLIMSLASESRTVMVISHDSDFLFAVCDYLCLYRRQGLDVHGKHILYSNIGVFDELGVEVPFVLKYAQTSGLIEEFKTLNIATVLHPMISNEV